MQKNKIINKGKKLLLLILFISTIFLTSEPINASSKYIKIDSFIKLLVQEIGLNVDKTEENPYIHAAIEGKIVEDGDFKNYSDYITRTDAAVLLNRADEYLHGDTVDEKLLEFVVNKRISDLKKVDKSKREAVAKVYAKGIIKGYSNGYYIQNRSFKGDGYITTTGAKNFIKLVTNTKDRAKLSPDGMLIRTTNLPKNYKKYEYILECYPNKFYEKKFEFMNSVQYKAGRRIPELEIFPVDIRKSTFKTWNEEWPLSIEMDKYLYDWTELAETYLNYIFNVDYRTVDENWVKGLSSVYINSNIDEAENLRSYYIKHLKANKVIVESSIIAVEPSTLYYDTGYCMRAYVRYRIIAKDINVMQNRLINAQYPNLTNLKSGQWREGIFDIRFGSNNGYSGDGSDWAIGRLTSFNDDIQ
ncbi:MAG: hypothetical protein K0S41_4061 [Anaerocolumna sp.]|jgi:hypothetical protein|nr:hypothetical protein [Anaerocolumna sp.]